MMRGFICLQTCEILSANLEVTSPHLPPRSNKQTSRGKLLFTLGTLPFYSLCKWKKWSWKSRKVHMHQGFSSPVSSQKPSQFARFLDQDSFTAPFCCLKPRDILKRASNGRNLLLKISILTLSHHFHLQRVLQGENSAFPLVDSKYVLLY